MLDLTAYLPLDEMRMRSIQEAFFALSTLSLTPVRSYLAELYGEEFTYEEIRSARLFLSPADRLEIESGMTL